MKVGMLGAVPYVVLFIAMQVNGYLSDKSGERRWHSAIPLFIAAAGLLGLASRPPSIPLSLVLFTMVAIGMADLPAFWTIPTEILSQSAAAVAVGMINAVGNIAGCRPLPVRLPEHAHRIIFVWTGPDDGLGTGRRIVDAVRSEEHTALSAEPSIG